MKGFDFGQNFPDRIVRHSPSMDCFVAVLAHPCEVGNFIDLSDWQGWVNVMAMVMSRIQLAAAAPANAFIAVERIFRFI